MWVLAWVVSKSKLVLQRRVSFNANVWNGTHTNIRTKDFILSFSMALPSAIYFINIIRPTKLRGCRWCVKWIILSRRWLCWEVRPVGIRLFVEEVLRKILTVSLCIQLSILLLSLRSRSVSLQQAARTWAFSSYLILVPTILVLLLNLPIIFWLELLEEWVGVFT